ncbi:hypothetical protein MC885_021219 [Smutsia gigantea]|nr:hypothetical protein MC885_021219 [Smutsia gigantea]
MGLLLCSPSRSTPLLSLLTARGCVYGWATQSGQLLWRLRGHTGGDPQPGWGDRRIRPVTALCKAYQPVKFCHFSPDSHLFASASSDSTIRLWDTAAAKGLQVLKFQSSLLQFGQMLHHLAGHQDSFQSSDFAPSSDCLVGRSMLMADVYRPLAPETPPIFHQELEGHSGNISCLCYSASGLLASSSWDKTILIWKPSTRSLLVQLKGHISWVKSIAFALNELQLANADYSHMVTPFHQTFPPISSPDHIPNCPK